MVEEVAAGMLRRAAENERKRKCSLPLWPLNPEFGGKGILISPHYSGSDGGAGRSIAAMGLHSDRVVLRCRVAQEPEKSACICVMLPVVSATVPGRGPQYRCNSREIDGRGMAHRLRAIARYYHRSTHPAVR